jgi:hypothetical protein
MGAIVNAANCTVTAAAAGAFVVAKTGGTDGALDAGAVSAAAIAGPFVLRVKPLGAGLFYAGVAADPAAGTGASGIDRALQVNAGNARPSDAGFLKPGTFALDTYLWMRRAGGLLQYLTGPVLATAVLKRTSGDPGPAMFFDCAIAAAGLAIEVRFDVPAAFAARRPRRGLALGLGF